MQLKANEVHVWSTDLTINSVEEEAKSSFLSPHEMDRANRFHFPIHKRRFIAAHAALREVLSFYLKISPENITFEYEERGKPYIRDVALQFNIAHSDELAVFALTLNHAIGIDVEKVQQTYNEAVALRYFTEQENLELLQSSAQQRLPGFYRLWARKEAVIKAIGKGLSIPLASFSVSSNEIILENSAWLLIDLPIHPEYQSALATNQMVKTISYWKFNDRNYNLVKSTTY